MTCPVCDTVSEALFVSKIMNKYDVQYYCCSNCKYVFTEQPYWLNEAYNSAINLSDTGIIDRNIHFSKIITTLIYFLFDKNKSFLDYAGGYGIFTRLMRDIGFDFYWLDQYCENLVARGFEYQNKINKDIELLSAFEVFEHLYNPLGEIKKMIDISENIIFSTQLIPDPVPKPNDWWYYGFDHGQHISFYSKKTLSFIAQKYGLNFYSYKDVHLFTRKKINPSIFLLLISLSKRGLFSIIKTRLKSKTWDDHLLMKNQTHF